MFEKVDPRLDLTLDRVVDLPPELIWKAWTEPKHLVNWFTPPPWKTVDCRIDLRPGGEFYTEMNGPAGEAFKSAGCYLEIVPSRKLVWTDALQGGFRPNANSMFTAFLYLEPQATGTRYYVIAKHKDEASRKQHEEMGFEQGWGLVLDQLVAYMKSLR